jgi:Antirestriction protein (ArdA)
MPGLPVPKQRLIVAVSPQLYLPTSATPYSFQETTMPNTTSTDDRPRVWIGCLGCYSSGRLVGDWYDADDCPTVMDDFKPIGIVLPWSHFAEQHEELWCFDHENFGGLLDGECSPCEARRLAELIDVATDRGIPGQVLAYWINDGNPTTDVDGLLDGLQDAFCGHWESGADYARDLASETTDQLETDTWPFCCIDWDHAWRELNYGGDVYAVPAADGGIYVLRAS